MFYVIALISYKGITWYNGLQSTSMCIALSLLVQVEQTTIHILNEALHYNMFLCAYAYIPRTVHHANDIKVPCIYNTMYLTQL